MNILFFLVLFSFVEQMWLNLWLLNCVVAFNTVDGYT